jgi:hypothetical protein
MSIEAAPGTSLVHVTKKNEVQLIRRIRVEHEELAEGMKYELPVTKDGNR